MSFPAVRARHLKQTLEGIAALPEAAAIREKLGELLLKDIQTANGFDWLPIEHDLALVRAERDVLGPERQAAFARAVVNASFHGPLLGRLVEAAMRLAGTDPLRWARWIPRGWPLVFSGCGSWAVGDPAADGTVTLSIAPLPPALVHDEAWCRSLAASLSAIVDLAGARGGIELTRLDPEARAATFALRWTRGGSPR
ncbi:MAG TPA: hypothetical protein VD838_22180 [Anaeromyxobacteraceae bacterium]|nr:hypothetical protein [Anaeromyxobacteraceae bacterium]